MSLVFFLSKFLTFKKVGYNYFSLCPFHNEKTPSFSVNDVKGVFFCFGCGVSGNLKTFLYLYKGVVDKKVLTLNYKSTDSLVYFGFTVLETLKFYFVSELFNVKCVVVLDYFCYLRRIFFNTIKLFGLGYAPALWYLDTKYLKNFSLRIFLKFGFLKKSVCNTYDLVFKNRCMFPIRDVVGCVVGFGGRCVSTYDKINSKYINSCNSIFFQKNEILYGLYEVILSKKKISMIFVVEGYFDVLRLSQDVGLPCVAILGTFISQYSIKLLFVYANKIVYCFDGDLPGLKAMWNAMKKSVSYYGSVSFIFFPFKYDPDKYIKKNFLYNFLQKIESVCLLFTFFFSYFFFMTEGLLFIKKFFYEVKIMIFQCEESILRIRLKNIFYKLIYTNFSVNKNNFFYLNIKNYFFYRFIIFLLKNRNYSIYVVDYFLKYTLYGGYFFSFFCECIYILRSNINMKICKFYKRLLCSTNANLCVFLAPKVSFVCNNEEFFSFLVSLLRVC